MFKFFLLNSNMILYKKFINYFKTKEIISFKVTVVVNSTNLNLFFSRGIEHHISCPHTLMDTTSIALSYCDIDALHTIVKKTYPLWFSKIKVFVFTGKTNYNFLKVFGCQCVCLMIFVLTMLTNSSITHFHVFFLATIMLTKGHAIPHGPELAPSTPPIPQTTHDTCPTILTRHST